MWLVSEVAWGASELSKDAEDDEHHNTHDDRADHPAAGLGGRHMRLRRFAVLVFNAHCVSQASRCCHGPAPHSRGPEALNGTAAVRAWTSLAEVLRPLPLARLLDAPRVEERTQRDLNRRLLGPHAERDGAQSGAFLRRDERGDLVGEARVARG